MIGTTGRNAFKLLLTSPKLTGGISALGTTDLAEVVTLLQQVFSKLENLICALVSKIQNIQSRVRPLDLSIQPLLFAFSNNKNLGK